MKDKETIFSFLCWLVNLCNLVGGNQVILCQTTIPCVCLLFFIHIQLIMDGVDESLLHKIKIYLLLLLLMLVVSIVQPGLFNEIKLK